MEELHEEEFKMEPRKRRPRRKSRLPLPGFLGRIGEDVRWYYDIRLWFPLILLLFVLAILPKGQTEQSVESTLETEPPTVQMVPEEDTTPTEPPVDPKAAALARLADTVGAGRSDNVKTIIMWVAINREEAGGANGYGLNQDLLEEIARPNQWQGYNENASYSSGTYAIAQQVLDTQLRGGLRPLDSDMFWFVLNNDGSITVRNQFVATGNQRWREKTVR